MLELDGQPLELPEGEILLGRSRSCTVTLPDPSISRQHAKLVLRQGLVRLRDLNSSNGTYLNDTRVQSETDVVDGDRIVLGETEMRFRAAAPDEVATTTAKMAAPAAAEGEEAPTERKVPGPTAVGAPPPPAARAGQSKQSTADMSTDRVKQVRPAPPAPAAAIPAPQRAVAAPAAMAVRPVGFWARIAGVLGLRKKPSGRNS